MDARERELLDAMLDDPRNEAAKVRYEQFLAEIRPDSIERELLQRQRELAESFADQALFDSLVNGYIAFRIANSTYFWDLRGNLDFLLRKFRVWLVSVKASRRFAVEQALRYSLDKKIDLDHLPAVIVDATSPDEARSTKEKIVEFVRRYRGPTGNEPELQPDEIVLAVTPSWVEAVQ